MKDFLKNNYRQFLGVIFVVFATLAAVLIIRHKQAKNNSAAAGSLSNAVNAEIKYEEAVYLETKRMSFEELKPYFQELAGKKGARYAFEVLKIARLPSNIDLHLLGHVVGDELYKQEGSKGMTACDNDFRNACSHSIVIGLFFDKGEAALPEIVDACRKAPGGSGAYTMCFHGLGHGILAYAGYDIAKAAAMCQKTGSEARRNREIDECAGGAVMEIVGGGFHDRDQWKAQRDKTLKKDRPLALCSQNFIPKSAAAMCYIYITPFLYQAIGGDLSRASPEETKKAFALCDKLPAKDISGREACFGGFGKEFIGIVLARNIRQAALNSIADEKLMRIYQWCRLADSAAGSRHCAVSAMNSLYWGGENDKNVAIRFCSLIADPDFSNPCFSGLIGAAFYYNKDEKYLEDFCAALPREHKQNCAQRLLKL